MIRRQGGLYPEIDLVSLTCVRQKNSIFLLRGHYHLSCARLLGDQTKTVVLLRDPVARSISHLKHMIAHFGYTREALRTALDKGQIPLPDNVQARYISGLVDVSTLADIVKRHRAKLAEPIADLRRFRDEALEALERTTFTGAVEKIGALVDAIAPHVPGGRLHLKRLNSSPDIDLALKASDMDLIREQNSVDVELHERALLRQPSSLVS